MRCASCGNEIAPGARFCRHCGSPVEADAPTRELRQSGGAACPECGEPVTAEAKFCRSCGARLGSGDPTPVSPQPVPPPAPARAAEPQQPAAYEQAPQPPAERPRRRGLTIALAAASCLAVGAAVGAAAALIGSDGDDPVEQPSPERAVADDREADEQGIQEGDEEGTPVSDGPSPAPGGSDGPRESRDDLLEHGFPNVPRARMAQDISDLLFEYHQALVDGRFKAAFRLLSQRKRRKYEREWDTWKKAQKAFQRSDPSGIEVRIDELEGDGVARVMVTGISYWNPNSPCDEWEGLTWVKYENGQWRYDPGASTTPERNRVWGDEESPEYKRLLGVGC